MLPSVTDPPKGNEKGLKTYRAPESAEKTIISANILVEEVVLIFSILLSLRQHYLDQVPRVDNKPVVLSAELYSAPHAPYSKRVHSLYLSLDGQVAA